jgi:hypothetical protein
MGIGVAVVAVAADAATGTTATGTAITGTIPITTRHTRPSRSSRQTNPMHRRKRSLSSHMPLPILME